MKKELWDMEEIEFGFTFLNMLKAIKKNLKIVDRYEELPEIALFRNKYRYAYTQFFNIIALMNKKGMLDTVSLFIIQIESQQSSVSKNEFFVSLVDSKLDNSNPKIFSIIIDVFNLYDFVLNYLQNLSDEAVLEIKQKQQVAIKNNERKIQQNNERKIDMDKIGLKINMITFLMTNFQSMKDVPNGVSLFKMNVNNLVKTNQLPSEIREIIYNMYGIVNSDTFFESRVELKLYQINTLMNTYNHTSRNEFIAYFVRECDDGNISKSAEKIIRAIYEIPEKVNVNNSVVNRINTTNPPQLSRDKMRTSDKLKKIDSHSRDEEVAKDISRIKQMYLPKMYYRFENPRYDGCSGSQKYLYQLVIDCKDIGKPKGASFYYRSESSDGCHTTVNYTEATPDMFSSIQIKSDPCTNGFNSLRGC